MSKTKAEKEAIRKSKVLKFYRFTCAFFKVPGLPGEVVKAMDSHELQKHGEDLIKSMPKRKQKKLVKFLHG